MSGAYSSDSAVSLSSVGERRADAPAVPQGYLASRAHEAAMQGLARGVRDGAGLLVLTGEAGSGKSVLCRRLAAELGRTFETIVCRGSGLDFGQLVNFLCAELDLTHTQPTPRSEVGALTEYLAAPAQRPVVLLVDDADRLEGTALEQLLGLRQTMEGTRRGLQLVLSGRPGLQPRLKRERSTFPIVRQGIFVRLGRFSNVEAATFVERVAARGAPLAFEPGAVHAIVTQAEGNPGRLISLCQSAVERAVADGAQSIGRAAVDAVPGDRRSADGAPHRDRRPAPDTPARAPDPVAGATPGATPAAERRPPGALLSRPGVAWTVAGACLAILAALLARNLWTERAPTAPASSQVSTPAPRPAPAPPPVPMPASPALDTAASGRAVELGDRRAPPSPPIPAAPAAEVASAPPPAGTATPNTASGAPPTPETAIPDATWSAPPSGEAAVLAREAPQPPAATAALPRAPEASPSPPRTRVTRPAPESTERSAPRPASATTPRARARAHVARARAAMGRNALTSPANDNAVKWAESALALDPRNRDAARLLQEVIDRYLARSNQSLQSGALADASRSLERAQSLSKHATADQIAAATVLEEQIAARERALARASRRRYQMEAPKWLNDLDEWVRGLPLPR